MYKYLIIISFSCLFSQTTGKLSGSVNDSDKNPLYGVNAVSYTHLRAHETKAKRVCRVMVEKK